MQNEKINNIIMWTKLDNLEPNKQWILLDNSALLHTEAQIVTEITNEDNLLINKMVSYIDACYNDEYKKYKIRPGIAIAGPQVGLMKNVIYIHFNENDIEHKYLLINPSIIAKSQTYSYIPDGEGCLSVEHDVKGNVKRHYKVIVKAYDLLQQKEIEISASNLLSICLQHEIDHLKGILYTDHINQDNPNYASSDWIKII